MKKSIILGVIGLVVGLLISGAVASIAVNTNNVSLKKAFAMNTSSMTMEDMNASLEGKTGDEFDKEFLAQMTMHHQGAVEMAKLAKQNAKHQELKDMADDIIDAQNKEILQMNTWQMDWGYVDMSSSTSMPGMTH